MLDISINPRPPRILYIGNADSNPGISYLNGLIDAGFNVFHVGKNSQNGFELKNLPEKPKYAQSTVGGAQVKIIEFALTSLLDIVGYDFDAIFHVQNWYYPTEKTLSPIPYFFYCTEIAYPEIPRSAWYVLSATNALKKIIKEECPWIKSFLYHPHSVPIRKGVPLKYPSFKRPIQSSFAGELYSLPLYNMRRDIVQTLEKENPDFETHYDGPRDPKTNERKPEKGRGHLNAVHYFNLLLKSKYVLNVPCVGGANFRDVEALSTGSTLVTIETPDLLLMGIEDQINCRTYSTKQEALEIIQSPWDEKIAREGWKTIFFGRKWWQQQSLGIAINFRYKGYKEYTDESKNHLAFYLKEDKYNVINIVKKLKEEGIIQKYKYSKTSLKITPKTADMEELILQRLGFVEWSIDGHTIYHRIKELSIYMNRSNGIRMPPNIDLILEEIKNQKKD